MLSIKNIIQAKRFLPSNSQPSQVFQTFCSFKGSKKVIFLDTSLGSKNPSKNRPRQRGPPQFTKGTGHELCVEQADWWHHETSSLARKPFASAAGCHGCMQLKKLPIGLVRTQVWALCLKSASTLLLCKSSTRSAANCCPQENQLPTDIAHHSSQGLHEPPSLKFVESGAFLDCSTLRRVVKLPGRHRWRGVHAEENAFAIRGST